MKNIITLMVFFVISLTALGQLKVDQYGRIGMGTNYPNPGYKCHMKGNLLLTTYPANPSIEFRFKVGNGWPGAEIGTTVDNIVFWTTYQGYNKLYAEQYYKQSDRTLKNNITPIKNGLNSVMKLNAYLYELKDIKFSENGEEIKYIRKEYGFISQEVEKEFPEVQITNDVLGVKLMDYDQIIPLTVAAIKEQQLIIDSLKHELENLKDIIYYNSNNNITFDVEENSIVKKSILYQNKPNPFNESTIIEYEIKETNFNSASIIIFDMNGTLLKSFPINSAGKNQLTINGNELKAGMYIYTLIVNKKEVDTKKMILLK